MSTGVEVPGAAAAAPARGQDKQREWHDQWSMLKDEERFLFEDWIARNRLTDFAGKDVLEGGCGGGQHTAFVAEHARTITVVFSIGVLHHTDDPDRSVANLIRASGTLRAGPGTGGA